MTMRRALGLMSGTSLDAVDVALIETDGSAVRVVRGPNGRLGELGRTHHRSYPETERALLRAALKDAEGLTDRRARPGRLAEAEDLVTRAHAEAVREFLARHGYDAGDIDVIGFHGQTVLHEPAPGTPDGLTVQIGDGAALARATGIPVVFDLRAADVAAGGQGAPLVPVFHRALAEASGLEGPIAILNIGGVANVTFIGRDGSLAAFDTGTGNALLNDWMMERTGRDRDEDGATAASGRPDETLLAWLLTHPYFAKRPPKSLDRNWLSHRVAGRLSTPDGAATLAAFTARSIARAAEHAPEAPRLWVVAGGGVHNGHLMALLRRSLGAEVVAADDLGWSADYLEAQAFAYLAVRHLEGLPLTLPGTTGVPAPTPGGVLANPGS